MHTRIELTGALNCRGIGEARTPWLVRSAAPDTITADDERLLRELGVNLILDLREPTERTTFTHSLPVKTVPLYGTTPPVTGTLEGVYSTLLRERGHRLAAALEVIGGHDGPVLVHCTAGKDRTGLVVALARLVAGDEEREIVADYALSGPEIHSRRAPLVNTMLNSLGVLGGAREEAMRLHLESPASAMQYALDTVRELGGAEKYLLASGIRPECLRAIAEKPVRVAYA